MRKLQLILILFLFLFQNVEISAQDIYVDVSVVGGAMDGTSWSDAYDDLQDALGSAINGDVIHVAEGTYHPHSSDTTVSFVMLDGVQILGGYSAGGGTPSERDWRTYLTILSGDLDGDDIEGVYAVNRDDNSEHVIKNDGNGLDETSILDGFLIKGGEAYQKSDDLGGGIYNNASSPLIINCIVKDCHANRGGGIANSNGAEAMYVNTIICGNSSILGGGAVNISFSSPTYINCVVSGNEASTFGGGMYNIQESEPLIINTTISGNYAAVDGGGLYQTNKAAPDVRNSIIWRNGDSSGNGTQGANVTNIFWGTAIFSYSIIQESKDPWGVWDPDVGMDGGNNIDSNPDFFNSINPANAPSCDGNFRIECSSPAINSGFNAYNDTDEDLAGNVRILVNIDMGAYEAVCDVGDCIMGNLYINDNYLNNHPFDDIFKATQKISSDAVIPNPRNITFQAGESIELLEDFEVEAGAVFTALIQNCAYLLQNFEVK